MIYEWNAAKAKANLRKHRVSFEEAATVFLDSFAVTFPDPDYSVEEQREITVGYTRRGRLLFISHCQREEHIRIISARKATNKERRQYEEIIGKEGTHW